MVTGGDGGGGDFVDPSKFENRATTLLRGERDRREKGDVERERERDAVGRGRDCQITAAGAADRGSAGGVCQADFGETNQNSVNFIFIKIVIIIVNHSDNNNKININKINTYF